ncbi:thioredoxin-like protein [Moesziomyces antarcticus]|uniref:Thioredoxin-like protein n=2 Tax=Pseudozyma antarctica TaxID=84753 RepID=A0A081CLM5_PSEA2|nr:thioredoxin-like protein [Moesziomyces antarcticus]GAK67571.1 thioredoxin-like protein [Moesziomyces antarcticus]SPO48836.1 probable Pig2 - related to protein disulfide isomerase [Moesziomyces antarcticus]
MRFASISSARTAASSYAWLVVAALLLFVLAPTARSAAAAAASSSDKATHDGLRKLTAANFTLTNQGAWLIEFFSPTCIHCKKFGATWNELSHNKDSLRTQYPHAPFTLAQVDCVAQWDLCKEQGVTFLPRLTIYQDGKQLSEEYKGDRNYPEISAYIDKFAADYRKSKGVADVAPVAQPDAPNKAADAANATAANAPAATDKLDSAASTNAPAPVNSATSSSSSTSSAMEAIKEVLPTGPNPKGELLSFGSAPIQTKEELQAWLGKASGQGPTFVKFFAPWCPHCKAMAAAFQQLSSSLKGRVNAVQVDCEANRALCASYDIRGYPVLRLYDQGHAKEYNGGRNHDAMLKWVLKAISTSGLKPVASASDLGAIAKDNDVLFLYLHSPGTPTEEVRAVEAASQILFGGRAPIFVSDEPALLDRYASSLAQDKAVSVPAKSALLVFKDHSIAEPVAVMHPSSLRSTSSADAEYSDDAKAQISRFLSKQKYALVTELTAANFEETVRNAEDALVVLAALSDSIHGDEVASTASDGIARKDAEIAALRSVALEWRLKKEASSPRQVVFAWIDADRWKSPLRKLYGIQAAHSPSAVLVDGNKSLYYELAHYADAKPATFEHQWITPNSIFADIDRVLSGDAPAKSSRTLLQKSVKGAEVYMNTLIDTSVDHPVAAFGFLFAVLAALFFYLGRARKSTPSSLPMYSKVSTVKAD